MYDFTTVLGCIFVWIQGWLFGMAVRQLLLSYDVALIEITSVRRS